MADAASYDPQALLSKPLDEVKAPVPLPIGSMLGTYVSREFTTRKTKEGDKTVVSFQVRLEEPLPDVQEDDWNAFIEGRGPEERQTKYDFWITQPALYRLKEAGEHAGVKDDEVANTAELIEAMIGRQAVFTTAASKPDANGRVYVNIERSAPVPE